MHQSNALLAALTLGFAILALSGCASSSSTKPDGNVSAAPAPERGIAPDRSLSAIVTRVERSSKETLAEIDAGGRDGVQKDWVMAVVNADAQFVAHLRITDVTEYRSTGVISLEQGTNRVTVGQKVFATPDSGSLTADR